MIAPHGSRPRWRDRGAIPPLYAILDAEAVQRAGRDLLEVAAEFRSAELPLLQYRDKQATEHELFERAAAIGRVFKDTGTVLILNDWPELCVAAGWHGVHVGQSDLAVDRARLIVGPDRLVGISTHTPEQVQAADKTDADYVAIGPVYATTSKFVPEPAVGVGGVEAARKLTGKPLVAIGGISAETAATALAAGADSVAVIGALLDLDGSVEDRARAMLRLCETERRHALRRAAAS